MTPDELKALNERAEAVQARSRELLERSARLRVTAANIATAWEPVRDAALAEREALRQ